MIDPQMIMDELKQQKELIRLQTHELSDIKKTLVGLAVQEEKISSLKTQVNGMWRKYDEAFGPEGTISKLKENYASCPKETIKHNLALQWMAIATIVAMITALKIWG